MFDFKEIPDSEIGFYYNPIFGTLIAVADSMDTVVFFNTKDRDVWEMNKKEFLADCEDCEKLTFKEGNELYNNKIAGKTYRFVQT
jgi:hypothetical protein